MKRQRKLSNQAWRWAFYDWANSAFATTVMAGFFPIFFKSYWASDLPDAESTFIIGSANSLVGLLIALFETRYSKQKQTLQTSYSSD